MLDEFFVITGVIAKSYKFLPLRKIRVLSIYNSSTARIYNLTFSLSVLIVSQLVAFCLRRIEATLWTACLVELDAELFGRRLQVECR